MNSAEQHLKHLSTLNAIGDILNREADFELALQEALERLVKLEDLATGWVFLKRQDAAETDKQNLSFRIVADMGLPQALSANDKAVLCEGGCECQSLFKKGQLDTGVNIVHCSRLEHAEGDKGELELHASMPLLGQAGPVGILNLAATGQTKFDSESLDFLTTVGKQLGTAFERSKLMIAREEEARYAATLEERQRLATDMHDSLAQLLFAADLSLTIAQETTQEQQKQANIAKASDLISAAQAELKSLVEVLRPADLSQGLRYALKRLSKRTSGSLTTHLEIDKLSLSEQQEEALYRISQEALHNVLKHANANTVWIKLHKRKNSLTLMIEDDGQGLKQPHKTGLGMHNMKARAKALNANLQFSKSAAGGLRLELTQHD